MFILHHCWVMINIMRTRNFGLLHSLKERLGMMESHVKTTADGYYTASVYSSLGLDFNLFFMFQPLVFWELLYSLQFQHTCFCCLFYIWRSLFILVTSVFIALSCLQMSVKVWRFLSVWVGLKKKHQNDISLGNFGLNATPYLERDIGKVLIFRFE